ncbi:MAG: hypothetical protein HY042_08670 [Spirochaetia bacterium]|nr:hypothetical protein [Spirochaetia bacterium]
MTQQKFDPKNFQPSTCTPGQMKCGLMPNSKEEMDSVPQADSNFVRHRGLPSKVDLSPNMPPIGNQEQQGSCVGWSTAYAIKSYHEQAERKWGYDSPFTGGAGTKVFSPAFVYNQINGGRDGGSNPMQALALMQKSGVATWKTMPYNMRDFRTQPSAAAKQEALNFREESYRQVDHFGPDAIKAELAAGNPILIGINVYDSFYNLGSNVYTKYDGQFYGGHAIAVVGYDDSKSTGSGKGAFKLFNSWSTQWGDKGYGWIAYDFMPTACLGAFVSYDMKAKTPDTKKPEPGPEVPEVTIDEEVVKVGPPTQVTATRGTFTNKVEVKWSPVSNAVSYEVQRANPGEDDFGKQGLAQQAGFVDTAVQPDVAYKYRVVAIGEKNRSNADASPIAEGFAKAQNTDSVPGKVTGLQGKVVAVAGTVVKLSWTAAGGAASYQIFRFDDNRRKWVKIGDAGDANFSDASPIAGGVNSYRVRGLNQRGPGEASTAVKVQVGGQQGPPSKVEGVAASEGTFKDRIVINWSPASGAQKYLVFRYNPETEKVSGPFGADKTEYTDTSAEARSGNAMAYVIVAGNPQGYSDYSEPVIGASNPNIQRAGEVLTPPRNLKGSINEQKGTVVLKWDDVKGAAEYYIFRKREKDSDYAFVKNIDGKQTTFEDKIPGKAGDVYMYAVRSKSSMGGESKNSNVIAAFINEKKETPKHRGMPDEGLDRFTGKWAARYWDGESAPKDVLVELSADGRKFNAVVTFGKNPPAKIAGTYVAQSDYIEAPGFKMQLRGQQSKVAVVEVTDGRYAPVDVRLAFNRAQ